MNKLQSANGENGVTVYKSIDKKVSKVVETMIIEDLYRVEFEIDSKKLNGKNKYSIEQDGKGCYKVLKLNTKKKIFKYKIYGSINKNQKIEIKYPKKLECCKKFKMRMYDNLIAVDSVINTDTKLTA